MFRFTSRGIGWLIAGGIISYLATRSSAVSSAKSAIMLGLVFIIVYFMKQYFEPDGIWWFVGGGILLAYLAEYGPTWDGLIALGVSVICLVTFYRKNKEYLGPIEEDPLGRPREEQDDIRKE